MRNNDRDACGSLEHEGKGGNSFVAERDMMHGK